MFRTLQTVQPETAAEQSAYDAWLSLTNAREEARLDRLHAAEGIVPLPMWIVLLLSAALVLVYVLFFADSGERAVVQGLMAGSVTAVVIASLLVLSSLNRPYDADVGGIRPVAMQRSLRSSGPLATHSTSMSRFRAMRSAGRCERPAQQRSTADRRIDTIAAVLLAMAAVATAWSSYQASRWTGEQAKAFATAQRRAGRVHAGRRTSRTPRRRSTSPSSSQWVDARLRDEPDLARFYEQRFRDEFKPAFQAWLRTDPFDDPSAPPSPFAMDEYQLAATQDANELSAAAEASAELARTYIQRATNYVLGVVLFATSLFFAGISTKLNSTRLRGVILGVGCIVFILAASWIATFPISLSI